MFWLGWLVAAVLCLILLYLVTYAKNRTIKELRAGVKRSLQHALELNKMVYDYKKTTEDLYEKVEFMKFKMCSAPIQEAFERKNGWVALHQATHYAHNENEVRTERKYVSLEDLFMKQIIAKDIQFTELSNCTVTHIGIWTAKHGGKILQSIPLPCAEGFEVLSGTYTITDLEVNVD